MTRVADATRHAARPLLLLVAALVLTAGVAVLPRPAAAAGPHARTAKEQAIITALINQVNAYRRQHRLPTLKANSHLAYSARMHDWRMTVQQRLAHQLKGESSLGSRITAAGYTWHAVGENIGYTNNRSLTGAKQIISLMYAEKAPNDPHRRNLLARSYADVGMDVYEDTAHNRLWLTTDFGHR